MSDVFTRDKHSLAHFSNHDLIRTLRGGTAAMRSAGTKYLPREPGETEFVLETNGKPEQVDPYRARLQRSVLVNYVDRVVDSYRGKIFAKPVVVTVGDSRAEFLISDLDGAGSGAGALASVAAEEMLFSGCGGFLVDTPPGGGEPYAAWYDSDSVIGGKVVNGEVTLLRLLEKIEIEDGEWSTKECERIRAFRKVDGRVEWSIFEKDSEGEAVSSGWRPYPLDTIPFVPVLSNGRKDSLFCDSPLRDLADLNLRHWQETSDQTNIEHVARVPILFYKGATDDSAAKIKIGVGHCVATTQTEADLKYVEHTGKSIETGRNAIKELELQMQALGMEMLVNKPTAETATGRAIDAAATSSALHTIIDSLSEALEKVLKIAAKFKYIEDLEVTVSINRDFGFATSDVPAIEKAHEKGVIDNDEYRCELERRGILRVSAQ